MAFGQEYGYFLKQHNIVKTQVLRKNHQWNHTH